MNILLCFFCKRRSCAHIIGVNDKAEMVETVMITHIIQPNWRNNTPDIPLTIVSGKNTAIMVSVEAITEMATSFVA